ncbi:MAG: cytochrome-c oxidase, cbb3-type subunit II [Geminicoccaceae bacterium]|nr:cytochrome-c oxidase, cbb3-type subunit II [Geminicoccaceae bacterium]
MSWFWDKHKIFETKLPVLAVGTLITVSIGGIVQIVPLFTIESTIERVEGVRPYSPLELAGRGIYLREGCYNCHSQMIRTFRDEVDRYGHYSLAAESMYDHPFQWGSKRTGPDLARIGGKYSNQWHQAHLTDPRSVVSGSIMPPYRFLNDDPLDFDAAAHMRTQVEVGVPYTDAMIENAAVDLRTQAANVDDENLEGLLERYPNAWHGDSDGTDEVTEMDALVAYLQILGRMVDFTDVRPEELVQ